MIGVLAVAIRLLTVTAVDSVSPKACHFGPTLGASTDQGTRLGVTARCMIGGDSSRSWQLDNRIGVGYESRSGGIVVDYLGQFRPSARGLGVSLGVNAASSDFTWFFGVGNATAFDNDTALGGDHYYRVRQSYFQLSPAVTIPLGSHVKVSAGPELRYWETSSLGGFVDSTRPYGIGPLGTVGALLDARLDTRDRPAHPTRGFDVQVEGRDVAGAWSAAKPYGTLTGTAATYLTPPILPMHLTFAIHVGGEKVWGVDVPYQDMAHIGGAAPGAPLTVRGYLPDRFAGDASAFGNVELEVPLVRPDGIPGIIGLLVINDVGRVYVAGETSHTWHDGVGGGLYYVGRPFPLQLAIVHGTDGTRVYLGGGRSL